VINAISMGMNTPLKFLFVLTAVATLSVAYPAKANLITNPGFETGDFTGWTPMVNAAVVGTFMNTAPHSGNYQALLGSTASISQTLTTMAGATYTIDFWVALIPSGRPNSLVVNWGGVTVLSLSNPVGFSYTEYTVNVTASTASTNLDFVSAPAQGTVHWFLDDISVNPTGVGVPDGGSTVSLLGCALLGLAAVRRKLSC
jgi:hypothetical protein